MFTIENTLNDVTLSQSGCQGHEDGLVIIDSGASVNDCSKWFGKSAPGQSDESSQLGGTDGKTLRDKGKRQIWLEIGNQLKRYELRVVAVTKTDPDCRLLVRTRN